MSKLRIDLIEKAFEKLDSTKDGVITVEDIERVRMSLALFSTRVLHVDQLGLCVLASLTCENVYTRITIGIRHVAHKACMSSP